MSHSTNDDGVTPDHSTYGYQPETHAGRAVIISIAAAVGGFLFGFDSSVINGAVDALAKDFELAAALTGVVVAIALIGSAIGAWFAGPLADRWGRLRVMFVGAILFLVSSLGSGFAFAAWDLAIWRLVGGIGIGIASVIGPTYISEIAPSRLRGRLASLQQMAIVLGIFVALLSDAWLATSAGGASSPLWAGLDAWRWMFLVGVVPSVIYGVMALSIPESPRFLVSRGRDAKAASVLQEVLGENREQAERRVAAIRDSVHRETKPSYRDVRDKKYFLLPIVWTGILLAVFQQFVGINVIFYYSTSLWSSVGFDESFSFTASVITSVINVLVTIIAIALVDRIGRRVLLLVGSLGMAVCLAVMAMGFGTASLVDGALQLAPGWGQLTLIAANAFVVFFGATWGPVMWVLLGEMFPNSIRGYAMAIATAANWIANWLVTLSFPVLRDLSLSLTYGMYAFFALLSFFFVFFRIPETKGMELEDMTTDFKVQRRRKAGAEAR
ncbi:MFS transporter [Tersicoccus solisilvae]|uniref:MFS transporter n=1 Tax=Tersicoccus solisilvae TaxID=1882339 RepID=A0ABQ1P341_9MICC|nr:sugar porter family MFS transporter [Tersicoccus solisilvae]GGC90081.1 MFS transporter [Tersicoccus solisilvae]